MLKTTLIALFCSLSLFASAQTELVTALQKMSELVKPTVEADKETIVQQMTWDDKSPWRVTLSIETTTKKDKFTERYEFNLADFNPYLVTRKSQDKYQGVECGTDRDRKYISYWENNEKSAYQYKLLAYFKDANAADEFVKQFKAAIPLAQTAWNATVLIPESLVDIRKFLAEKIVTVTSDDEKLVQTLRFDDKTADRAILTMEESGSGEARTDVYEWCWGDLDANSIELKAKGEEVAVEVETRRDIRFVTHSQNGNFKGYRKDLVFGANSPDEAKIIIKALEKIIPLGEKALEARVPQINSLADGIQLLNAQLTPITSKGLRIEQALTGSTDAKLVRKEIDEEDKENNENLAFEWFMGDLDPNGVSLNISSGKISISAQTLKKDKLVACQNNGEAANYDNEVTLEFANIEAARLANAALPQIIALVPKTEIKPETADWVISAAADMPSFKGKQAVTFKKSDNGCTWTLVLVTTTDKKTQEETWEFDLNRIDPNAVEFVVSGKNINLELPAKYKEKVFKYYRDGKQSFVNSIRFPVDSIAKAKQMEKTWKSLVENCK